MLNIFLIDIAISKIRIRQDTSLFPNYLLTEVHIVMDSKYSHSNKDLVVDAQESDEPKKEYHYPQGKFDLRNYHQDCG